MIPGKSVMETVLYYSPEDPPYVSKLKGVMVRMGIRIKNVSAAQVMEQVGALAGMKGFAKTLDQNEAPAQKEELPVIPEEVLVMCNFSRRRMDEFMMNLRKAGVPKIQLKAIVTETNCRWTFYHLYEEISEEHARMQKSSLS